MVGLVSTLRFEPAAPAGGRWAATAWFRVAGAARSLGDPKRDGLGPARHGIKRSPMLSCV
jgi:hypothetical protein